MNFANAQKLSPAKISTTIVLFSKNFLLYGIWDDMCACIIKCNVRAVAELFEFTCVLYM